MNYLFFRQISFVFLFQEVFGFDLFDTYRAGTQTPIVAGWIGFVNERPFSLSWLMRIMAVMRKIIENFRAYTAKSIKFKLTTTQGTHFGLL